MASSVSSVAASSTAASDITGTYEPPEKLRHGHSIMHCKAPVWVKPNLGEAQLGHQASAEYKLRFCLHLRDVYFGDVYSAGSETERVALKKRSETQNRSTIQIFTTKYVSENYCLLRPNSIFERYT